MGELSKMVVMVVVVSGGGRGSSLGAGSRRKRRRWRKGGRGVSFRGTNEDEDAGAQGLIE